MKLDKESIVVVETLADIHRAINEFLPGNEPKNPVVEADLKDDGKTYHLTAPTGCTYRDMLIEGFTIITKRLDATKQKHAGVISPLNTDGHMWLDDLVTRRLGGVRDGARVRWDIKEGTFYFDPFTGKLTKSQK